MCKAIYSFVIYKAKEVILKRFWICNRCEKAQEMSSFGLSEYITIRWNPEVGESYLILKKSHEKLKMEMRLETEKRV